MPDDEAVDSPKYNGLKTGPPLIGVILNWWLFGIFLMQYLLYLSNGTRKDGKVFRVIVHFLCLLDTVQSILTMEDAFRWFVFNFGNYEALSRSGLPGIDSPLLDGIIALTVQLVYCWRIWALSKWRVLPIIVAFLAFVSGVSGFICGISEVTSSFVDSTKIRLWFIPAVLWAWGAVATDIFIAATMSYLLTSKSRDCNKGIKAVAKRLLILTLETNALTAIAAVVTGTLFPTLGPPLTNFHRIGGYILGKLYSNCFMVLLNQRIYYEKLSQEERSTMEVKTLEAPGLSGRPRNPDAVGEVSTIQFSGVTTQSDFKPGPDDDVELGQGMGGLRIIVDTAGAAGKK